METEIDGVSSPIKSSRMTSFGRCVGVVANPPVEHTVLYQTKLLILLVTHVFSTTVEVSPMITPESVLKCFAALLNTSERASISTAVFKGIIKGIITCHKVII